MSVVKLSEKNVTLTIESNVGESFTPDDEIKRLAKEIEDIRLSKKNLDSRLTKVLEDCHNWNRKNDEVYESNYKKMLAKQSSATQRTTGEVGGEEKPPSNK